MPEKILIPLDGSEVGEAALEVVQDVISKFKPEIDIEITLLQVLTSLTHYVVAGDTSVQVLYTQEELDQIKNTAIDYLKKAGERLISRPGVTVIPKVVSGSATDEILKTAEEINADTIAMSTHGRSGITRLALGSVTERVLRSSKRPILVVRATKQ